MAEFASARRYYLSKRRAAEAVGDDAIANLWQGKQLADPGTALPDGFPHKAALALAGYVADSDLVGADTDELMEAAGLTLSAAQSVLTAAAAL